MQTSCFYYLPVNTFLPICLQEIETKMTKEGRTIFGRKGIVLADENYDPRHSSIKVGFYWRNEMLRRWTRRSITLSPAQSVSSFYFYMW